MTVSEVCVDASFLLKLVIPEPDSTVITAKWAAWVQGGTAIMAPSLWLFESQSVLRRKVVRQELTDVEAQNAWRILQQQRIRTVHPRGLFDHAWLLASTFGRPTTYDAVYMAVADLRGCELWTADQHLVNATAGKLNYIRTI